jgi:DNA-binding CsgD family transcriptional regulator
MRACGTHARERQVFAFVARGHSSKQISSILGISPRNVDSHRANVRKKLGVHGVAGLVRFAARIHTLHRHENPDTHTHGPQAASPSTVR